MRRHETAFGVAAWVAVAVLMPMSALEPVAPATPSGAAAGPLAAGLCSDGSARLVMGCDSVHL